MRGPKNKLNKASSQVKDRAVPFNACFAKTFQTPEGISKTGRTVYEHCLIVAEVAKELVARIPEKIAKKLFPRGFELAAGIHDVGKISPTFQKKILQNTHGFQPGDYPFLNIEPQLESLWGGHAGTSQICLDEINPGPYIPEISGQHHGFTPSTGLYTAQGKVLGGEVWQRERESFVEELKRELQTQWPEIKSPEQARLIAGVTSVADWIGSGAYFENPAKPWQDSISTALDRAGFISPRFRKNLDFKHIFGFSPYEIQEKLFIHTTGPGVYILEAPMGLGKTEAALYAAYQLLSNEKARGIYFALPTQLTSNKIYERFNTFLDAILDPGFKNRQALLLHGSAWLLHGSDMGEEGRPGGAWFNTGKRGILAPFAVGTIDQALMAAMNVKHGFVRAFGLSGKVVILDEVHTYDVYTGTILDALIKLLQHLSCTVIILSATLSRQRKQMLIGSKLEARDYPLVTAIKPGLTTIEDPVMDHSSVEVTIRFQTDDAPAKEIALDRAADGQQVLWIENSVEDAQRTYLSMAARAAELGVASGLLHSRFTPEHRREKENFWVSQFGKKGWETRGQQGRLLIGTQVLEQSLDIDADFLVTRFCPTDMLFQRIGRLWRHEGTPRHTRAKRQALLIMPDSSSLKKNPKTAFGVSGYIYNPYVLHRSLDVWGKCQTIRLPDDIRPLIEATYQEQEENGFMAELIYELENGTRYTKGKNALRQLAQITLSKEGKTLPETKAQTRYSEMESIDVLLLKDISAPPGKKETRLTLINGESVVLPWARYRLGQKEWKNKAVSLMNQIVKTGFKTAPIQIPRNWLEKIGLGNCLYIGKEEHDESLLRVALVDETGTLKGYQGAPVHDTRILQYRKDLGYCSMKQKE